MITFIKWIFTALFAGFLWMIGKYTAEYFDTKSHIHIK